MAYVMIVDDDADGCRPLVLCLERAGHRVQCFPDGRPALAAVIAGPPDAVVLDLFVPEMDGPSFVEVVRL